MLPRILVTLIYGVALLFLVNNFSLIALIIATVILILVWFFIYLVPAKVEFDSSVMIVTQSGDKHMVNLEDIQSIGVAGVFGRQKSYCVKYLYQEKVCTVEFKGRILLINFEEFCKSVRAKNPKAHIELPYPLDNC